MERHLKACIAILMISYFGACAPVTFDTLPQNKVDNVVTRCVGTSCFYDITEEKTVGEGLVDILIVNDNSGSMSFEQAKMATAFSGFLTSIAKYDYRIAMITTDAGTNGANAYNGNGAFTGGRLIEFAPGVKYLDRSTYNKETLFNSTVNRQETKNCEASGFTQCPAGDERPLASMALSVKQYVSQFVRPNAHFAVIVLSDEDERSVSALNPCNYSGYPTAPQDKANCEAVKAAFPTTGNEPQQFIDVFRAVYPSKTLGIHSIIVKPDDIGCRNAQTGQVPANPPVLGFEGYSMARASQLTGGIVGNICEANYTNQLQQIGYTIGDKVTSLPFRCRPHDDTYTVTFTNTLNGAVTNAPSGSYSADYINSMLLTINVELEPSTKVTLKYSCAK